MPRGEEHHQTTRPTNIEAPLSLLPWRGAMVMGYSGFGFGPIKARFGVPVVHWHVWRAPNDFLPKVTEQAPRGLGAADEP
jgi:hypothetical protein